MGRWKVIGDVNLYFITTTIVDWQNVFMSLRMFEMVIDSLKCCIVHRRLHLHGYVIMPNHAHYILSTEQPKELSEIVRDYNRFTSQQIITQLGEMHSEEILSKFREAATIDRRGNSHKVWQDGFHPIAIETEVFFREKLNYLHENPVRKGFVELPEHWKFSSARNYISGDHSIINVECL